MKTSINVQQSLDSKTLADLNFILVLIETRHSFTTRKTYLDLFSVLIKTNRGLSLPKA